MLLEVKSGEDYARKLLEPAGHDLAADLFTTIKSVFFNNVRAE